MGKLLTGKKILVMGVANQRSIAWGCAQVMAEQGAELIYTYQNERMKKSVAKLVADDTHLVECDVASDESIQTAFATIKARFGQLDGLVHAIAYAKKEELGGSITNVTRAGYALAVVPDLPGARLPGLRYIPLPEFEPLSFCAMYLPGERTPALRTLLALLEEVLRSAQ